MSSYLCPSDGNLYVTIVIRAFFPVKGYDASVLEGIKDPNWKMLVPLLIFTGNIIMFGFWSAPVVKFLSDVAAGVY